MASRERAGGWTGREAEKEGRMNERSLEVSLATKGFEMILKQEHSLI